MPLPGLFIGIPSSGRPVDIRWAFALQQLGVNAHVGSFTTWEIEMGPDRARNREKIAEDAVAAGARYLFMLDDDTVPPNFALRALAYELEKDPSIMVIGGIYTTKEPQPCPLVFKRIGDGPFWNWKQGEVFDVEGIGTGCMMIKTEVFEHLSKPWFHEPNEAPVGETRIVGGREIPVSHRSGTDDLWFCQKVIDAGFRIRAHGGVLCPHIGQDGKLYGLTEDTYPMRPKEDGCSIERALKVEGWMTPEELTYLAQAAKKRKNIVEIGSWMGRSTCALAANTSGRVTAIDTWEGTAGEVFIDKDGLTRSHADILAGKDTNWLFEQFAHNVKGLPVIPAKISSLEAARNLPVGNPDMVFLDASHDYESIKADIEAWKPLLDEGGIICGHDYNWPGVTQAVKELIPNFRVVGTIWTTEAA